MGSQNGTYVPWHEPVWGHAKTKAAATMLLDAGVPVEYAPLVVGAAVHRLSCWALRDGETGRTGRLTDAELAQIAWPEGVARGRWKPAKVGAMLRAALRSSGYLEGDGADECIHDFLDHNRRVIADRIKKRTERAVSADTSADRSEDSPQTGCGHVGGVSAPRARVRQRHTTYGIGSGSQNPPHPPEDGGALASPTDGTGPGGGEAGGISLAPGVGVGPRRRDAIAAMRTGVRVVPCDDCGKPAEDGGQLCEYHANLARGGTRRGASS